MRLAERDDGAVAILVAAMALMIFGLSAIVVDLGFARQVRSDAQDSADAAALAGAGALYKNEFSTSPDFAAALAAVSSSATANFDAPTRLRDWVCPVPTLPSALVWDSNRSGTRCVQFGRVRGRPTSQVFVAMPTRKVESFFAGVFQVHSYEINADAIAGTETSTLPTCGLCVSATMTVNDGATVQVSGGSSLSVGQSVLTAPAGPTPVVVVRDGGKVTFNSEPSSPDPRYDPPDLVPDWPVDDPLAGRPQPTPGSFATTTPVVCDGTNVDRLRSGRYQDVTISGECRLRGTFQFSGNLTIAPSAQLDAERATLVFDAAASLTNNAAQLQIGHARGSTFSLYWLSSTPLVLTGTEVDLGADVFASSTDVSLTSPRTHIDGALTASSLMLGAGAGLDMAVDADSTRVQHGQLGLIR